jgi:hypothetical protein
MPDLDFAGLREAAQTAFKPHFSDVERLAAARRRRRTRVAGAAVAVAALAASGTAAVVVVVVQESPHVPGPAAGPFNPTPRPNSGRVDPARVGLPTAGDLDHLYLLWRDCRGSKDPVPPGSEVNGCALMVAATADRGKTWRSHPLPIQRAANAQGWLRALGPQTLLARMQEGRPEDSRGRAHYLFSADGGATWREVHPRRVDAIPAGSRVLTGSFEQEITAAARCGTVREAATRDEHGRPLCPQCLIVDPANQESCRDCGRRRPVAVRTADGPLCESCRPWKILTCGICARTAPCLISQTTGQPWCRACKQRWARCTSCGRVEPVRAGTADAPLCATCARPEPEFWRNCTNCGQPGRLHAGNCTRCVLKQRLLDLLSDQNGEIRPELAALHDNLASYERPTTVLRWLDKSDAPAILRELGAGQRQLTHDALDELPDSKPLRHLRAILVATGTLPSRDEHMARLERWTTRTIAGRASPNEQQLLHRYAVWHLMRRLRRRLHTAHATHQQAVGVQQHLKAAITLLDWLATRGLSLATGQQGDLRHLADQ